MGQQVVLTGITTTGTPHLGNYVGAIRPAIAKAGGNRAPQNPAERSEHNGHAVDGADSG